MERTSIPVSETKGLGFGPFSGTHNNLNPTLEVSDEGLHIGILQTTTVPWSELGPVHLRDGLTRRYLEINGSGIRFAVHFPNQAAMDQLLALLTEREVEGSAAAARGEIGPGDTPAQSGLRGLLLMVVVLGVMMFVVVSLAFCAGAIDLVMG